MPAHELAEGRQHGVPGRVSKAVVEVFEVVDVEEDDPQRPLVPGRARNLAVDRLLHVAAVEETGQRVADGLDAQRLAEVEVRHRQAQVLGDRLGQRLHLLDATAHGRIPGDHHVQHAHGRASGHHGDAQVGSVARGHVRAAQLLAEFGDHVRLAAAQRPAVLRREDLLAPSRPAPGRDRLHQVALVEHAERAGLGREQLLDGGGDHGLRLFGREAGLEHVGHLVEQVGLVVAPLQVGHVGRELDVRRAQLVLHPAPLADVGKGEHGALVDPTVEDRVAGVLDREGGAVRPPEELALEARADAFCRGPEDRAFLLREGAAVGARMVRQPVQVAADQVRRLDAEQARRCAIDEGAMTTRVNAADPLARRLEDQAHRVGDVRMTLEKDHVGRRRSRVAAVAGGFWPSPHVAAPILMPKAAERAPGFPQSYSCAITMQATSGSAKETSG